MPHDPVQIALIILALPLAAFLLQIFFGRRLPRQGDWLPTAAVFAGWGLASWLFFGGVLGHEHGIAPAMRQWSWFAVGGLDVKFGILVDNVTAIMLFVVTTVSSLVHLYSCAYMRDHHGHPEPRYNRFFAYLALFTFSMILLVIADNLFFLYMAWELVGLCSYFLIGFYFQKPSAAHASMKAFVVNRVGDFGFFIGIMIVFATTGKLNFHDVFATVRDGLWDPSWLTLAGVCLFCGAIGKSAQFPLHVWLPDAMEGPTPVSALIHAATMVAAGVYMVARLFPVFAGPGFWQGDFFSSPALWVVAGIGSITAFMAATIAIVQSDIKKGLAYSTVSQLGYMVLAIGVGSFTAGLYHLFTHAFFKACLFLGSGSVIHAVGTNEMTEMGGLRKKMPITFATFLISTCAIAGVPFLSGFYSKEAIVTQALAFGIYHGKGAALLPFAAGIVTAGLTAFYMFRLVFLTFTGKPRDHHRFDHAHESPAAITIPLVVLAILAVVAGGVVPAKSEWFAAKVGPDVIVNRYMAAVDGKEWTPAEGHEGAREAGMGPAHGERTPTAESLAAAAESATAAARFERAHEEAHRPTMVMSLFMAAAGIGLSMALFLFGPFSYKVFAPAGSPLAGPKKFLQNLWYIDWAYYKFVVGAAHVVRRVLDWFDENVIDRLVNVAALVGVLVSKITGALDYWGVDGAVRGTANVTLRAGDEARRVQTGRLQEYVYLSIVLIAFIFVVWTVAGTIQ
jgi:NADH-quinone oxidoreductase subunit L